jgi:hypothetical protein
MSTIFDLLYREYCRARLAEMRKQLLIPVANDEILEVHSDGGDPAGPSDRGSGWGDAAATNEAQPSGSRYS